MIFIALLNEPTPGNIATLDLTILSGSLEILTSPPKYLKTFVDLDCPCRSQ